MRYFKAKSDLGVFFFLVSFSLTAMMIKHG
jgi:hypothetical protein